MTDPARLARETSPLRARIGAEVAARLTAAGAGRSDAAGFTLWYGEAFLDAAECAFLIERIEAARQPSATLADRPLDAFRTSESGNLDRWDHQVRRIDRRICALLGIDERQGETLQGQRYAPGQYFRPHHDFFYTDQAYWAEQARCGGQRTWTAMIFLNAPEAGGETAFTAAGLVVPPRAGMLLAWNNMDVHGAPNPLSVHEGRPVMGGVKFIVTKWYREGNWV